MRKAVWIFVILALGFMFVGCNGKENNQTRIDQDLALKFLLGIQSGDQKIMYEAANLTPKMVSESREKLINQKQNQLTELQRTEYEHALRISGQIDVLLAKTRPMFPKSASFQIKETTAKSSKDGGRHVVHLVKILYANKTEAMRDKTGKPVKEMFVRLQQLTRPVGGRSIHSLSFEGKDFEKFADRDFEVLSYF